MRQRSPQFFSSPITRDSGCWNVVYLGFSYGLFFDINNNQLLGLGSPVDFAGFGQRSPWQIRLNPEEKVKQIAAHNYHILVLYENGDLEGYGLSDCGELGIGRYSQYVSSSVKIELPEGAKPVYIAAGVSCSFVIADNQNLYGFGSNDRGQLGFENTDSIHFPTKIPLPSDCIPEQIFSNHNVTLILGKNNTVYGFGSQSYYHFGYESGSGFKLPPVRLKHFETHRPKAIAIGRYGTVLLASNGECIFYGTPGLACLPHKNGKIQLPDKVFAEQISYTNDGFLLLSTENELWQASKTFTQGEFIKVNLASPIERIYAGSFCSLVKTQDDFYAWGDNLSFKKGDEKEQKLDHPEPLYLSRILYGTKPYIKPKSYQLNPNKPALLKLMYDYKYWDNTKFIEQLEKERAEILEIISPALSGKSSLIAMLQHFYDKQDGKINCFEDKLIWQNAKTRLSYGRYPVLIFDLAKLDLSSSSKFCFSLNQLISEFYLYYRPLLFTGILNKNPSEQQLYQNLAMNPNPFKLNETALRQLIHYLSTQHGTSLKFFIDNPSQEIKDEDIRKQLTRFIDLTIVDNPNLSQVVIFSEHPSLFSLGNKKSECINKSNSRYAPFFVSKEVKIFNSIQHPLFKAKISKDSCLLLENLLKHGSLPFSGPLCYSPYPQEESLVSWLIFGGFLTFKENTSAHITNDLAREALQELLKIGRIQNQKRIIFAVDIDNCMATTDHASKQTALFFLKAGFIISACGATHYIPPGRKEFVKYLYSLPTTRVVFFSSGMEERNKEFVQKLLIKALGKEKYQQIKNGSLVFSKSHCRFNQESEDLIQKTNYGLPSPSNEIKKDLNICLESGDLLENTCLIDDDPSVVYYGQEGNYFRMEAVGTALYEKLYTVQNFEEHPRDPLFRALNDVFRITALIANSVKVKDQRTLKELLFPLHFKPKNVFELTYTPRWETEFMNMELYVQGLEILRKFNPALTFITPQSYLACIQDNVDSDEERFIEEARKKEHVDCRLM